MPEATWESHEKHGRLTKQSDLPDSVYAFPNHRNEPEEVPTKKSVGSRCPRWLNAVVNGILVRNRPALVELPGGPVRLAPPTKLADWLLHFRTRLFLLVICVVRGLTTTNRVVWSPNEAYRFCVMNAS
jgi:hypothetical protein